MSGHDAAIPGHDTGMMSYGSRAHIFVAALGASSYTFACATPRETMADWLHGCARALSFFGGVPQLIVPDNPRAMIASPNRYEPRTNDTVADFARHYGTSVLPARPRHPQDKARAESAVQVVQRWILMRLRHQRFASVDDLNEAMAPLLNRLNSKPFQKLPGSRASAFADLDAPALQPLPLQPCPPRFPWRSWSHRPRPTGAATVSRWPRVRWTFGPGWSSTTSATRAWPARGPCALPPCRAFRARWFTRLAAARPAASPMNFASAIRSAR